MSNGMVTSGSNCEPTIPRLGRHLAFLFLGLASTLILFSLRGWRRMGGDDDFAQSMAQQYFSIFYVRSPLTIYLHQAVYHFIAAPLGFSPADAVGFCSAVGGGIFVVALVAISRHWLFLLFNLAAPFMFIFLGHVEHYAWVNALLAVYFLAVKRHLDGGRPLWPALVWLLLAASFHMLAIFYFPTILFLLAERDPATRRWRWRQSRSERENLLLIFNLWAILVIGGQLYLVVGGLDNGVTRLVPLFMPDRTTHYFFSLFSWAHLKMWLYFHWMSSPLGLIGLVLLGWAIRARFEKFLLVAVACGFLWTWMWHPDRGRGDWDLFANLALPLNILVGLLLAKLAQRLNRKRGTDNA